jgi:predicted 3-demethylubiquinone-9 3-methyltransferase (glyoxalase superfamily)
VKRAPRKSRKTAASRASRASTRAGTRARPAVKPVYRTQKITPFLWFDSQAEEAATFYCSVFRNSRIAKIARYPKGAPGPAGQVMTVEFEIVGQKFIALNGGPHFVFNESVSFVVDCENQAEVDYYWDKLLAGGGKPSQCGWLKDKYGLSWQIVPRRLNELYAQGGDAAERVMHAMLKMVKLDVARLEAAAGGGVVQKRPAKRA